MSKYPAPVNSLFAPSLAFAELVGLSSLETILENSRDHWDALEVGHNRKEDERDKVEGAQE